MKAQAASFTVRTCGKGTSEITGEVARIVRESGVKTGTVTVFIRHTSASLIIYENADPSARTDLHEFFERLVPEDSNYFVHTAEGSDDMPSHLRMVRSPAKMCRALSLHTTIAVSLHRRMVRSCAKMRRVRSRATSRRVRP